MKRALFIGRFNPYHKGHDSVTKEMDNNTSIDEIISGRLFLLKKTIFHYHLNLPF